MKAIFERSNRFLAEPLQPGPRLLIVLAFLLLIPTYLLPLWQVTLVAPEHPDGLRLSIYSYKLEGGNGGRDIPEINVLNRSIGMKELTAAEFMEFKWIPFVVGMLALLFLRAPVHGKLSDLIDVVVLYVYFGLFLLWSFGYELYAYGHDLAPTAPVSVPPFMPPLFGSRKLADFEVSSYPAAGSYFLAAVAVTLLVAFVVAFRQTRQEQAAEARSAG